MSVPMFHVAFEPIEFNALRKILDQVGVLVGGTGKKADRLKLKLPARASDGLTTCQLSYAEILVLQAAAKIAVGMNDFHSTILDDDREERYEQIQCANAVLLALEETLAKIERET